MPELSPEVDLLERLTGDDTSLYEAAFGSCYEFRDLDHVKRVVTIYLKSKFVELYDKQAETEAAIPFHTGRWLVEDDTHWGMETRYYLRLSLLDQPGVFARVARILGDHHVGIASLRQEERRVGEYVPVIIVSHLAREAAFRDALQAIDNLGLSNRKAVCFRIETF